VRGPNNQFRATIARQIDELEAAADPEAALNDVLARIQDAAAGDQGRAVNTMDAAYQELAAIESWASLASQAVQRVYVERSPNLLWLKGKKDAGWSTDDVERLRRIADGLKDKLRPVAKKLGGVGFGIGVGFPIGISISISYTF